MENEGIRINKYLSEAGICSRREADREVERGNITINGRTAVMGDRIKENDHVLFEGREVTREEENIILVYNKPVGVVCTAEKKEKNNIVDRINYRKRIYPVGRLDKDSEGLILMTNNGEIVNKMMRAGNLHEKEYVVTVNKDITGEFLRGLSGGVPLKELYTTTRPCKVKKTGKRQFTIILTQGLNRQIRRMCEYFGYRVVALKRIRIMNIRLGELASGQYRDITDEEWEILKRMIKDSSNETVGYQTGD